MSIHSKTLCLALALAIGGAAVAQDTPQADREELRRELREAQRQLAEVGKRVAELSAEIGGDPARVQMFRYLGDPDRAVIGVILGEGTGEGARVEGVTPGGPAEKAGLRAGDIITGVGGASIAGERPTLALREALKGLREGDKVNLSFSRDGNLQSVEVAATRQGSFEWLGGGSNMRSFVFESKDGQSIHFPPGMDSEIEAIVEGAVGDPAGLRVNVMAMPALGGLRLSSLNKDLGRYFGVDAGVLVMEVDSERYKGLQAGDVILEVDGKPVKDPRDYMRELGRSDPDRPVELKLQRDRVPQLVKITVPGKAHAFRVPPLPPTPPAPPAPPAVPRAMSAPAPAPQAPVTI